MKNLLKLKDYMYGEKFDLQYFMMLITELDEGQYDVLIHNFYNDAMPDGWFCHIYSDKQTVEDRISVKVFGHLNPSVACQECYKLFIEELDNRGIKN